VHIYLYIYIYIYMYRYVAVALSFCVVLLPPPNMCFSLNRSCLQVSLLYCLCSLSFCVAQVFFILCSKVSSYHLLHEKSPILSPINLNPLNRKLFSQKKTYVQFPLVFLISMQRGLLYHLLHEKSPILSLINLNSLQKNLCSLKRNLFSQTNL